MRSGQGSIWAIVAKELLHCEDIALARGQKRDKDDKQEGERGDASMSLRANGDALFREQELEFALFHRVPLLLTA
jgi:hypothetical protein